MCLATGPSVVTLSPSQKAGSKSAPQHVPAQIGNREPGPTTRQNQTRDFEHFSSATPKILERHKGKTPDTKAHKSRTTDTTTILIALSCPLAPRETTTLRTTRADTETKQVVIVFDVDSGDHKRSDGPELTGTVSSSVGREVIRVLLVCARDSGPSGLKRSGGPIGRQSEGKPAT